MDVVGFGKGFGEICSQHAHIALVQFGCVSRSTSDMLGMPPVLRPPAISCAGPKRYPCRPPPSDPVALLDSTDRSPFVGQVQCCVKLVFYVFRRGMVRIFVNQCSRCQGSLSCNTACVHW